MQAYRLVLRCFVELPFFCLIFAASPCALAAPASTTTTLAVTSSGSIVNSVESGTVVTLTATVQSGGTVVAPGTVDFCDATAIHCTDIHKVGTAQLTKAGTATMRFVPVIGSHSYKAVFVGTTGMADSASIQSTLNVTGLSRTVAFVSASGTPGNYTLTASVGGTATTAPSGTVFFQDAFNSTSTLASATLASTGFSLSPAPGPASTTIAVSVGDLNNDGMPDVAVVDGAGVSVFLSNGDGTFKQSIQGLTGLQPAGLALGDFNSDGALDLAITNSGSNSVTILLGNADGSFSATALRPPTGLGPVGVAVGDFNRDGILDLAVTNTISKSLSILLGNGDGTFTATAASPQIGIFKSVAVSDFNNDGIQDIVVSGKGSLSFLLGNGDGTFSGGVDQAGSPQIAPVVVGDFNGDGNSDLAVPENSQLGNIVIYLGQGDGTFSSASSHQGINATDLVVGDFNGDGIADLGALSTGIAEVALGQGDGSFARTSVVKALSSQSGRVAAGDFNGDGVDDLTSGQSVFIAMEKASVGTVSQFALPVATGNHYIVANYGGDALDSGSSSNSIILRALPGSTTASLSTSVSATVYATPVTLTATFTGSGLFPTGAVTFVDGVTGLGTVSMGSGGVATFTTSTLAPGSHLIFANYNGDSNNGGATSNSVAVTIGQSVSASFASIVVCLPGQTNSQPCSQTKTLGYSVDAGDPVSTVKVLTAGIPNLDFTLAGGSTCTAYSPGMTSCTVNVTFAPKLAGSRVGAVQLIDASGKVLATTFIYGIGAGSQIAFGPGVQTTLPATGLNQPVGAAVDGAGNVFIADALNSRIVRVSAGGGQQVALGIGLSRPRGVAVDGAGNVFVADFHQTSVIEIPAGGGAQIMVGSGLNGPQAVAVDGSGNIFIADSNNNRVVKISTGSATQTTVGSGLNGPVGVAADAAGNVFIADTFNNRVVEVPVGGGEQTVVVGGLSSPTWKLAVDAAGDVFIADAANNRVLEVPAGGGPQISLGTGLNTPYGVAVDAPGNVYIVDTLHSRVVQLQRSQPPILNFAATAVGSTSSDSPQSIKIQNVGNSNLTTSSLAVGKYFALVAGSGTPVDCTSNSTLTPGATCNLSVSFTPTSTGQLQSSAVLKDNSLNSTPATQSIQLLGIGQVSSQAITFKALPTQSVGVSFALAATASSGLPVSFTSLTSAVCTVSGTIAAVATTGTCTIQASQAGNSAYQAAPPVSQSFLVTGQVQTITFNAVAAQVAGTSLALTASASSGLPVSFASASPTICTVLGTTAKLLIAGSCTIQATQAGNTIYAPASPVSRSFAVNAILTTTGLVSSLNPSLSGQTVTFTATVKANSGAVPTGIVKFMHSTTVLGTGTLANGVATFATSTLPVATQSITAVYAGGSTDAGSASGIVAQTVLIATTTVLSSTPNPSVSGQVVTFTATVKAASGAVPTGSVNFMHSTTILGTSSLTNGVATFTTSALPVATQSITAVYAGHSTDGGSTSQVVKQVVLIPTTTTLTSSPNPSVLNQAVKFTATVKAGSGAIPTGTVNFMHSTTLLGTGTLNGGVATFTTSTLPQATLSITAVYAGHSTDAASTSTVLKQVVNK